MGVLRIAPQVGYFLSEGLSWWQLLLDDAEPIAGHGACGFWMTLFVYLKFVELMDTLFLIIRDRRVTFLHGYHHATVLVFCWMCYIYRPAVGIIFTLMNNCVHAIMYLYYGLTAIGFHPRWSIGVTFIQILQMLVGKMLCGGIAYLHWMDHPEMTTERAKRTLAIAIVGTVIYVSYFYLFVSLFVHRYIGVKRKPLKLDKVKVV
jgi:hypothetical protein